MNQLEKRKFQTFFSIPMVLTLMLFAFYLRIKPAILRPIIFDEAFTVTNLIKNSNILDLIKADPSVPPLNYLLIKFLSNFSTKALWLRLPSIIFSLIGLFLSYKLANKFSYRVALLTLLILSFSTFQINYAWQAYVYAQLFFLGMLAIYHFFILLTDKKAKKQNSRALIIYVSSTLAFFTHYGFIWTIVAFVIIASYKLFKNKFNFKKIDKTDKRIIISTIAICLSIFAYTPIFLKIFNEAITNISWFKEINIYSFGKSINNLLGFYDVFSFNTFLVSKLNNILFSVISIFFVIYLLQFKNQKINFLIIVSMCNLLLPIFFSILMRSSIHADRAIIVASSTLSILLSILVKKLLNGKNYYFFLIFFSIFFLTFTSKINRTEYYVFQQEDLSKYFVDWFRENPENLREEKKFLIYYDKFSSLDTIQLSNTNYFVFDYYWRGYDGKPPLYEYKKINKIEEIDQENFYLLSFKEPDKTICLNNKITRIDLNDQNKKPSFFSFYDSLEVYLYECNAQ